MIKNDEMINSYSGNHNGIVNGTKNATLLKTMAAINHNNNVIENGDTKFQQQYEPIHTDTISFSLSHNDNLNDIIELSDENYRLRKRYDVLLGKFNDLEDNYDSLIAEKDSLIDDNHRHMLELNEIKRKLNSSIDINEYERSQAELNDTKIQLNESLAQEKQCRKELENQAKSMALLQNRIKQLEGQIEKLNSELEDEEKSKVLVPILLGDNEYLKNVIEQFKMALDNMDQENDELRQMIVQCQIDHDRIKRSNRNRSSIRSRISTAEIDSILSRQNSLSQKSYQNPIDIQKSSSKLSLLFPSSYSNMNSINHVSSTERTLANQTFPNNVSETMADVKIIDLEQQLLIVNEERDQLKEENKKLRSEKIDSGEKIMKQKTIESNNEKMTRDQMIQVNLIESFKSQTSLNIETILVEKIEKNLTTTDNEDAKVVNEFVENVQKTTGNDENPKKKKKKKNCFMKLFCFKVFD